MRNWLAAMFLWIILFAACVALPTDEFKGLTNDGELSVNNDPYQMPIVPSGYSPHKLQQNSVVNLNGDVAKETQNSSASVLHAKKGYMSKGLTFSIYDDNMREGVIALFRWLSSQDTDNFTNAVEWANKNINKRMVDYALRLVSLYGNNSLNREKEPPFINNPNYFINSQAIIKAYELKLNHGNFDPEEGRINQISKTDDIISINVNYSYSNWHSNNTSHLINLAYFREDIALNSYYYGMHLQTPFWMSNKEISAIDSKRIERYYFAHRQLQARYHLEQEHLKTKNNSEATLCPDYDPNLIYENGHKFPIRITSAKLNLHYLEQLAKIDIALKEFISRRIGISENGSMATLDDKTYIKLLGNLIREIADGSKSGKIVRSLFGYGKDINSLGDYNPAPSVLHHPETSLRDYQYWRLIELLLDYFKLYAGSLKPFNLTKYATDDFIISINNSSSESCVTYFEYFQLDLKNILENNDYSYIRSPLTFTARQRRLNHKPFHIDLDVVAKRDAPGIVRIFLGPPCDDCCGVYSDYFELDQFLYNFTKGLNHLIWSPDTSNRYSSDNYFNLELSPQPTVNDYNIYKFPRNLAIPRGTKEGINFTLFIMVTPVEEPHEWNTNHSDKNLIYLFDGKVIGFPYHRQFQGLPTNDYPNFKVFNFTIYHRSSPNNNGNYFPSYVQ